MSWLQAILIGLMSCTAASTIACLGTTVGNYTLNRPLVASLFVGLILGDVSGCIQIGIPILLIIFGMLDLGKAVVAGKEDEIKKNQQLLVKRAISAVAVFFVVTLVTLVFGLFASSGTAGEDTYEDSWTECWNEA
jgi:mannose/fructose/N-acetylgalactosamine-specific phosphotransferase system component IIC